MHKVTIKRNCKEVLQLLTERLSAQGLQIVRSFDLKTARIAHPECSCPRHGNKDCDCQMVVLLIYGDGESPISLVFHNDNEETNFTMVDRNRSSQNSSLEDILLETIVLETLDGLI